MDSTTGRTSRQASRLRSAATRLISAGEASALAGLFREVANPTRLRMLQALIECAELTVGDLAAVSEASIQATSNHLQRLTDRGIVQARREGPFVYYRIIHPAVPQLIGYGRGIADEVDPREP